MTPGGAIWRRCHMTDPKCHMAAVSYDGPRRHMAAASYDGPEVSYDGGVI